MKKVTLKRKCLSEALDFSKLPSNSEIVSYDYSNDLLEFSFVYKDTCCYACDEFCGRESCPYLEEQDE